MLVLTGNQTEVLGVLGLSWQEKLSKLVKTETGISVSSTDINRMNEAYLKGVTAGLTMVNLIDYIAGTSGIKNAIVAKVFVSNIEKFKTLPGTNPLGAVSGILSKLVILSGIALTGYFIVKSNIMKRLPI